MLQPSTQLSFPKLSLSFLKIFPSLCQGWKVTLRVKLGLINLSAAAVVRRATCSGGSAPFALAWGPFSPRCCFSHVLFQRQPVWQHRGKKASGVGFFFFLLLWQKWELLAWALTVWGVPSAESVQTDTSAFMHEGLAWMSVHMQPLTCRKNATLTHLGC